MQALLSRNKNDIALVVGNGINRYNAPEGTNAWEDMLTELARRHIDPRHARVPAGVTTTEFYDVLDLALRTAGVKTSLQADFCELMGNWVPLPQHRHIVAWARAHSAPILTTNFENTLGQTCSATISRCGKDGFTAVYPWSTCYSVDPVASPLNQFAIWHINGMQRYRQSIRLGLSHYMGSVARARRWLHDSGTRLLGARSITHWPGANTWLQVFMHKPLVFLGLGLGENEVFLRWLLIERARYFHKFPDRYRPAWYVHTPSTLEPGRNLFLRGVGVDPHPVAGYRTAPQCSIHSGLAARAAPRRSRPVWMVVKRRTRSAPAMRVTAAWPAARCTA